MAMPPPPLPPFLPPPTPHLPLPPLPSLSKRNLLQMPLLPPQQQQHKPHQLAPPQPAALRAHQSPPENGNANHGIRTRATVTIRIMKSDERAAMQQWRSIGIESSTQRTPNTLSPMSRANGEMSYRSTFYWKFSKRQSINMDLCQRLSTLAACVHYGDEFHSHHIYGTPWICRRGQRIAAKSIWRESLQHTFDGVRMLTWVNQHFYLITTIPPGNLSVSSIVFEYHSDLFRFFSFI